MRGPVVLFILAALVVVELLAWVILATWGWIIGSQWGDVAGVLGAILAFALVVLAWSRLASRKARTPQPVRWAAKALILGGAVATLAGTGQTAAAIGFGFVTLALVVVSETTPVQDVLDALSEPRER